MKVILRLVVIITVITLTCSCYQLTKRSSTVYRTERLINDYIRNNKIMIDSTNKVIINLEEVLGIQYDSLLTFDAYDTCFDVQIITGDTSYGPKKGGYIGGGWESEAELLILMKYGKIVYDDSHTWESSKMSIPYKTVVTKVTDGSPRLYGAGISYCKYFYLTAEKRHDSKRFYSATYKHFVLTPVEPD